MQVSGKPQIDVNYVNINLYRGMSFVKFLPFFRLDKTKLIEAKKVLNFFLIERKLTLCRHQRKTFKLFKHRNQLSTGTV